MADRYDLDRDRDRDRDRERDWERHRQGRTQNEHWGRGSGNWMGEERRQEWGRGGERDRGREEWRPERTDEYSGRGDWGNQGAWGRFGNRSDWRHDHDWENRGDWERGRSDWEGRGQFSDDFERRNDWERGRGDWGNRDWGNRDSNRGESGRSRQFTGSDAVGAWGSIGGFAGGATSYGGGMGSYSGQGRFAGRGPKGWQRSDERIREDINERLTDHPHVDATEIDVQVKGGVVTLTGTVDDRNAKRLAEDIAENVSGVRDVQNQLRVQAATHTGVAHTGGSSITGR